MSAVTQHLFKETDRLLRLHPTADAEHARALFHDRFVPHLLAFLEKHVEPMPAVRSVAAFGSLAPDPVDTERPIILYTLPRPLRSRVQIETSAFIRPLVFLFDQYERYAVIVADRKRARFFTVVLGEIEEQEEVVSDTPARHDQGGWSQKRFQRHVDEHIETHVKAIVHRAEERLAHLPTHRILLGGDADMLPRLRHHLSSTLQRRVVGTFPLDVHASLHTIRERTMALARDIEHAEEETHVGSLRNALAHRGRAVAGVSDTLRALTEHAALMLLVHKGFHAPGAVCGNCGALFPSTPMCIHCHTRTTPTDDVIEHAVEQAEQQRAHVEFVEDNAELASLGNIGALLRFPLSD